MLHGYHRRVDDSGVDSRNRGQGCGILRRQSADERWDKVGRQACFNHRAGYLSGQLDTEAGTECRAVDGREHCCANCSGGGRDGGGSGDQVMRRRELDGCDDEDERGAKTETGEASKYEGSQIIARLDIGEADKSGGID